MRGLILAVTGVALARAVSAQCPDGGQPPCRGARPPSMSVAVLPFRSIGPDTSQQYFADGIADAILDALAQIPGMKVIGRSSSFAFRNRDIGARVIAESLGVAKLVEGSVTKAGGRVRVSARLIDAASGTTLWSEPVVRDEADLFELQDTVSRAIANRLGATAAGGKRLVGRATASVSAQDHYLRGRDLLYRRDPASLAAAAEAFRQAIRADARHAPSWAGLSHANSLYLPIHLWATANKATNADSTYGMAAHALAAANRAISLDSMLPEAWAVRGYLKVFVSGPAGEAEQDLRRALQLRPSYSEAHGWLAQLIAFSRGETSQAMAEISRAIDLDPASIGMRLGYWNVIWAARDHARTLETGRAMALLRPELVIVASLNEASALIALGRTEECLRLPSLPPIRGAMCLHAAGRREEAAARVDSLVHVWERGGNAPYFMLDFARYYGMTGQVDEFIKWVTISYARVPVLFGIENGGLSDPVLTAERGRARTAWQSLRQAAWDRIVRESRTAQLP